jgi:DNA-binding NarL/FixJ family response regulator
MLRAGAISYVVKGTGGEEVLDSVHRAIRGHASLPAIAASAVGAELRGQLEQTHDRVISLRRVLDRGL